MRFIVGGGCTSTFSGRIASKEVATRQRELSAAHINDQRVHSFEYPIQEIRSARHDDVCHHH